MLKPKVLHLLSSSSFSGAENVAITIIGGSRMDFQSVYCSPNGPIKETLESRGIRFYPIEKLSIREIRNVIRDVQPNIVHAHDFRASLISAISNIKVPIISQIHQNPDWLANYFDVRYIVFFISCFRLSNVLLLTNSIKDRIFHKLFSKKLSILPNSCDVDRIRVLAQESPSEDYDIAFVGRLSEVKDPLRFLQLITELKRTFPYIKVAMVGDGELRNDCLELIEQNNLKSNVCLKGFLDNPFPIISRSKLLVMTSKSEGIPMSLLEAASLGVPVIFPNLPSLKDLADNGLGVVCSQNKDFVKTIIEILNDSSVHQNLVTKARLFTERYIDPRAYIERISNIYIKNLQR